MLEEKEITVQFTNHQHSQVQLGLLPVGVRCLQVMTGSGRPFAMQTRVTLLPSFTVMSEEILEIFGGTVKTKVSWTLLPRLVEGSLSDLYLLIDQRQPQTPLAGAVLLITTWVSEIISQ